MKAATKVVAVAPTAAVDGHRMKPALSDLRRAEKGLAKLIGEIIELTLVRQDCEQTFKEMALEVLQSAHNAHGDVLAALEELLPDDAPERTVQ